MLDTMPTGVEIAHAYLDSLRDDEIGLYRDGDSYCYAYREGAYDFDYKGTYLLSIRTALHGEQETRDYLIVVWDTRDLKVKMTCEWFGRSIRFDAPLDDWKDHQSAALLWFTNYTIASLID